VQHCGTGIKQHPKDIQCHPSITQSQPKGIGDIQQQPLLSGDKTKKRKL